MSDAVVGGLICLEVLTLLTLGWDVRNSRSNFGEPRRLGASPFLSSRGYVLSASINNGRGAAFRPLHGPHFPGARGNPQRHSECATLKRRKRRAPFARATPTLNTYPGPQQQSWWKGSGMLQTTSTERRASGGDRPRSGGVSRCAGSSWQFVKLSVQGANARSRHPYPQYRVRGCQLAAVTRGQALLIPASGALTWFVVDH